MKVGIVYPYFAHYRGPLIEELLEDNYKDYYFLGGTIVPNNLKSLKLHPFEGEKANRFIKLKNLWFFNYFLIQFNLIKTIRREKFSCLIFFGDWKYLSYWYTLFYCRRNKIPCLFWGHGVLDNKKDLNTKLKYEFLELFPKGGLLYSEKAKKTMIKGGYKKELRVIYNSIDYKKQLYYNDNAKQEKFNLFKNDYPYVIFSGRLINIRKLDVLLKAVSILKAGNTELNVLIIGNGPMEESLKRMTNDLNLDDNVIFYGACYDEKILAQFFKNSMCSVFPGPIGLSLIHGMTYGTPVIINDNYDSQKPEIEAFVEGQTGFVFAENDALSLSNVLTRMLDLSTDTRNKMKAKSAEIIKEKYNPLVQTNLINKRIDEIFS